MKVRIISNLIFYGTWKVLSHWDHPHPPPSPHCNYVKSIKKGGGVASAGFFKLLRDVDLPGQWTWVLWSLWWSGPPGRAPVYRPWLGGWGCQFCGSCRHLWSFWCHWMPLLEKMQWNVLEYVQYRDKLRQKYIKILILVIIINIMQVGAYDGL